MYLSRFRVKNYKCLGDIDIPLTPIHVLIGENDAGKTSLLEAMAALYASSRRDLRYVFPEPWSGRELVRHDQLPPVIELAGACGTSRNDAPKGTPTTFEYGLRIAFPSEGSECLRDAEWFELAGERKAFPNVGGPVYSAVARWLTHPPVPEDWQEIVEGVSAFLRAAHKYRLDAKIMAFPAAIEPRRRFRMDPDGFGLPTMLDDILGQDAELFIHLRKEFCDLFPQFRSVQVRSENAVQRHYGAGDVIANSTWANGKGIWFETRGGQTVRAQQASDGAILFLGLLALAHLPEPPSLLLLEEPENGIYPKRLGEVITLLKQMVNRTEGVRFPQIIMSTHSPYVLSFFEPEEVTFLSRPPGQPDGPVRARPLRDAPNIRERLAGGEFYLGEIWYNLSEEDLFGEP